MAKFEVELPKDIMEDLKKLQRGSDDMFGEMTKAGAEVIEKNLKNNAPSYLKKHVKLTKTYKTPSDDGVNTRAYISGYVPFSDPNRQYFARRNREGGSMYKTSKGVPAEFLANVNEYGRSGNPFPKKPFLRKSMKKAEIQKAMINKQNDWLKGKLKTYSDAVPDGNWHDAELTPFDY